MESNVIEAKQASKFLKGGVNEVKLAFSDLTFSVKHGHRLGLFSVNSYESKTLLDCFAGVEQPDIGRILHHGSVSWPVGSNKTFHNKLSGYTNSRFAAEIYSKPGCIEEDLHLIQEITGVNDTIFHEPLESWDGSSRKALKLAVSLAFEFDVIAVGKIGMWDHREIHPESIRIRKLFEHRIEGRTLVIAAPGQNKFALDYCDHGMAIIEGRLAYQGDPEICLEMIKEETQRIKHEFQEQYNARLAQLLKGEEDSETDFDDVTLGS